MLPAWAPGLFKAIVSLIANVLLEEIISEDIFARFRITLVRQKINQIIEEKFSDSLSMYPGFQSEIEGNRFIDFITQPRIANELAKITHPTELPDIDILTEEWLNIFGNPLQGNIRLVIETFLKKLKKGLWEVKELREILHIQETHQANTLTSSLTPQIASNVSRIVTILEEKEDYYEISDEEKQLNARIDTCRDLLRKNRPHAAFDLLNDLDKELIDQQVSSHLRFRLNTLLGGCEHELGNEQEAINRYKNALRLSPKNSIAVANAALAALLENQIEQSIDLARQAIEQNGEKTCAPAVLVHAVTIQRKFKDLDDLIEDKYLDNIDYIRALGDVFSQSHEYHKAEEYYRLCLAQNPNDFHSNINLAQVIIDTRVAPFNRYSFLLRVKNQDQIGALNESMNLVNNALDVAQKGDNEANVWQGLVARAGIRLMMGDIDAAKADSDLVLKNFPNHIGALHNRGILALLDQEFNQAIELFDRLPDDYRVKENVVFAIARAYIGVGEADKVLELMEKFTGAGGSVEDYRVIVFKAGAWIEQGKVDEAEKIKEEMLQREPDSIEALRAASFISALRKNFTEATQYLENAYNLAGVDDTQKEELCLQLATLYYSSRDYSKASEWFKKPDQAFIKDITLARAYIQSLYATKLYGDAYTISKQARELGVIDPVLLEIEAWLAEYFGDLKTALSLEKILVDIVPENISHLMQCARLEFRIGNQQDARDILRTIDVEKIKDPHELIQIAEMYSFFEEPKTAIEIAYRARNIGQNSPEIHLAYSYLFLRVDDDLNNLSPEAVSPNTAVHLIGDDSKWIKLISIVPCNEANWEFSPDSMHGKLLIGRRVGESVTFKSGPLEDLTYSVREIQSIFVRAFQETLNEFGSRFPNHPGLHKLKIVDEDYTKFFIFLHRQSTFAEKVYKFYESGGLSIEQFANLISRNQIDIFTSLQGLIDQRVFASFGSEEDQKKQIEFVASAKSIVLDITGLLTFSYLDLLHTIAKRFEHIYIPQSLLDLFERTLAERFFELKKGRMTIGFSGEIPLIEEFTPEVIEKNIGYLHELKNFIHDNCEVVTIPPDLASMLVLPEEPLKNIGQNSIRTILIAHYLKIPLFADDARLRQFAEQNHGVKGFWSQVLLQDMVKNKIIDDDSYVQACVKLSVANYYFIAVNAQIIIRFLRSTSYFIDHRFEGILSGLKGPDAFEDQVIPIGAQVLKDVWLAAIPLPQKCLILDSVLRALCYGRNCVNVLTKLSNLVKVLLFVAPIQQIDLPKQINLWYQTMD